MGYFPLFLENYYQTTRDGFSSLCVYLSIPVCPRFLEYPRILITFYEALQDWDLGGHSSARPLAKSLQGFQFRGGQGKTHFFSMEVIPPLGRSVPSVQVPPSLDLFPPEEFLFHCAGYFKLFTIA